MRGAMGSSKRRFLGGKGRREPEEREWDHPSYSLKQLSPQQQIHPFYPRAAAEALHGGETPDNAVNFLRTQQCC